jgi:type IV pilus assembly protein PilB
MMPEPNELNNIFPPSETNKFQTNENQDAKKQPFADGITGFIESLIRKNIVSRKTVNEAVVWKKANNGNDKRLLFQIIIDEFKAERETVYAEFARYYSFKTIDLENADLERERLVFINKLLDGIPRKIRESAILNKILPYQQTEGDSSKLQIITPDPSNPEIATIARAFTYPKYEICYMALSNYDALSRELLADTQSRPSSTTMEYLDEEHDLQIDDLDEEIRKGHLNEIVDNIFSDAVRLNASDIHIIPKGARKTEIHFRVDGHLSLWQTLDDLRADAVAAVIKDIAKGTDRFERNSAQDGFVQITIDNKIIRFRVSIIPLIGKELKVKLESIVLRVLRDPEASITVENIGFQPAALERFRKAIDKPYGIVILTGPTGSGKSTTLLAALRAVMNPAFNIITVEDPVEYFIDGARQVKLNPKLNFDEALRAILRHDPDIVMVGEIRDKQTADLAIKLANTGHLTFSTLHTNDAPSVIARLYKMGIEPFLLAYSINIIVAQRLLRKLCPRCKAVDTEIPQVTLERLGFTEEEIPIAKVYRPVGCLYCLKGYKGRTAIHEVLYFTKEVRQLILESGSAINEEALRQLAIKQGMQTLRQSGLELLKQGVTTMEEVATTTMDD